MPKDMISKELNDEMNKQIVEELHSGYIYMAMAAWAEEQGLHNFAKFMQTHAEKEEFEHAMKLVRFIQEAGGHVEYGQIDGTSTTAYKDVKDVLKMAIKHEQHITARINTLKEVAKKNNDVYANQIIQWFLLEQMEEENLFEDLLDQLELMDGRIGLWNSHVKHP